jgi:hypothetical protein
MLLFLSRSLTPGAGLGSISGRLSERLQEKTMDGVGTFSKKFSFVGRLVGADLINGAEFKVPATALGRDRAYLAYLGNRVNLYINDGISSVSRAAAGRGLGIAVGWLFTSYDEENPNNTYSIREVDWRGDVQVGVNPLRYAFNENKVEFGCDETLNSGGDTDHSSMQYGTMDVSVYKFPKSIRGLTGAIFGMGDLNTRRVIPVVARADFMRVFFWSDPTTFVPGVADDVEIWAISGSDVSGSQVIGGGHG